jgi:hypothetical protein
MGLLFLSRSTGREPFGYAELVQIIQVINEELYDETEFVIPKLKQIRLEAIFLPPRPRKRLTFTAGFFLLRVSYTRRLFVPSATATTPCTTASRLPLTFSGFTLPDSSRAAQGS